MVLSEHEVVQEILEHVKSRGGAYNTWYVGITKDPKDRLFHEHCVIKEKDNWCYQTTHSLNSARNAEQKLLDYGFDGGGGGGDEQTKFVYAYKKQSHTKP